MILEKLPQWKTGLSGVFPSDDLVTSSNSDSWERITTAGVDSPTALQDVSICNKNNLFQHNLGKGLN